MANEMTFSFRIAAAGAAKFAKDFGDMGGTVKGLQRDVSQFNKTAGDNSKVIALRNSVKSAGERFNEAQARVKELREQIGDTHKPSALLTKDLKDAEKAALGEQRAITRLNDQLERAEKAAGATGRSTKELTRQQKDNARQASEAARQQRALSDIMEKQAGQKAFRGGIRRAGVRVGILGAAMGLTAKQASDFNTELRKVGNIGGMTAEEMEGLGKEVRNLTTSYALSRDDVLLAAKAMVRGGSSAEEVGEHMKHVADLAQGAGVSMETAAGGVAQALSAWNLEASETARVSDVLAKSAQMGGLDVEDFSKQLDKIGPAAMAAGQTIEQTSAMMSILTKDGVEASRAGRTVRDALIKLNNPGKKAEEALAALGIATHFTDGSMRDITDIMSDVAKSTEHLGDQATNTALSDIFGDTTGAQLSVIVRDNGEAMREMSSQMSGAAGTAAALSGAAGEDLGAQLKILGNNASDLTQTFGDALVPVLETITPMITEIVGGIKSWADDNPELASTVATVAGVATVLAGGMLAIGYAASLISSGMLAMKGAMILAKGATLGLNVAMLANPVFPIIAGIAALVAAGVLLYKNWDKVSEFFSGAWTSMRDGVGNAMTAIKDAVAAGMEWVKGVLRAGVELLKKILWDWNPYVIMTKLVMDIVKAPEEVIPKLLQSGKDMIKALVDGIRSMAGAPVKALKGALKSARDLLPFSDAKDGPLSDLTLSGERILTTMGDGVEKAGRAGGLRGAIAGALPDVSSMVGNVMGGGGGTTVNVTQNITVNGNASSGDVRAGATDGAEDLIAQIEQAMARKNRLAYD